jgi:phytoene/squalene synthetase
MKELYNKSCEMCSSIITKNYSTSFASAIKLLHKDLRQPICNIYGFVRFADEIVDTFHQLDKAKTLEEFKIETYRSIEIEHSMNAILHSFQKTVNEYKIDLKLIEAFFHSMELDLHKTNYTSNEYETYIYGSAEVVGLMCLYIFCEGKVEEYKQLEPYARSLGSAFQKVNFLRDVKADYDGLNRMYFPNCDFNNFTYEDKKTIEDDIQKDFVNALIGVKKLPLKARLGVFVAYKYYVRLLKSIKTKQPAAILNSRIRVPNYSKAIILAKATLRNQFNIIG